MKSLSSPTKQTGQARAQQSRLELQIPPEGTEGGIGNKTNSLAAVQMVVKPTLEGSIIIDRGGKVLIQPGVELQ